MYWAEIFQYGFLGAVGMTVFVFAALWVNPRLMLQDYPKDVQSSVPGKSALEKRQSLYVAIPLMLILLGLPLLFSVVLHRQHPVVSDLMIALNTFLVFLIFNLVDWLIVDWLIICTITPAFVIIPGTAGMPGYKNYAMHFRGFLIGTAVGGVASLIFAEVAKVLH